MPRFLVSILLLALPLLACEHQCPPTFPSGYSPVDVTLTFDRYLYETPNAMATDHENLYVTLAIPGEVLRVDPQGLRHSLAFLPKGSCTQQFPVILGALAINDLTHNLYVPVNSCDPALKGVYQVTPTGEIALLGHLPQDVQSLGIALRLGQAYVTDSKSPRVFRVPLTGTEDAEVWLVEPMLVDSNPTDILPGAHGLQFYEGHLWISNAGAHSMISIALDYPQDGGKDIQPGEVTRVFGPKGATWETSLDSFPGCQDFAFDMAGGIYCATGVFQTVLFLNPITGEVQTILTARDGLDGPTSVVFGRGDQDRTLYISNAKYPYLYSTGQLPSVLQLMVPVDGYPLR